ncbi:hypothetical protein [Streptomyces sp. CRN 30]|uniref:hypothetical protein n=1 Tax=Streptomyces sp. CRN 30 TaxID=3075613 RepID=UPI002A8280FF|nr:hypothetical protein [Streptomyces sp. CRN 30]
MDGVASNARNDHEVDWLEQFADLPHLIARVSELVLRLGYDPDELVTLPRSELDRRETAAYSAGWADVVDEQLPAIRRAYEERITAAYLQGQADARTGRRPRRVRRMDDSSGGDVIQLPYVPLLRAPAEMTRVEQRESAPQGRTAPRNGGSPFAPPPAESTRDALLSAREVREKRPLAIEHRPVVRRNGRPSVPPLDLPGDPGAAGRDRARRTDGQDHDHDPVSGAPDAADATGTDDSQRLSARARALADDLEQRAGGRHRDGQSEAPDRR